MHVYNNYYNDIGVPGNTGSFMGPGWGAEFIVENNYFGSKSGKTIEWFDTSAAYPVKFYYSGNNIADSNTGWWGRASDPKPWAPAYQYTLESNAGLPMSVPAGAGPTLVFLKQ
jgi:pectate lyase